MFQAPLQCLSWFEIPLFDLERVERLHGALHDDPSAQAELADAIERFTDGEGRRLCWGLQ
jgi:hypothetical protein